MLSPNLSVSEYILTYKINHINIPSIFQIKKRSQLFFLNSTQYFLKYILYCYSFREKEISQPHGR